MAPPAASNGDECTDENWSKLEKSSQAGGGRDKAKANSTRTSTEPEKLGLSAYETEHVNNSGEDTRTFKDVTNVKARTQGRRMMHHENAANSFTKASKSPREDSTCVDRETWDKEPRLNMFNKMNLVGSMLLLKQQSSGHEMGPKTAKQMISDSKAKSSDKIDQDASLSSWILPSIVAISFLTFITLYSFRTIIYERHLAPANEQLTFTEDREWNEITYYYRICNKSDITTFSYDDIKVDVEAGDDPVEMVMTHGLAVIPSILKKETAEALREYVIEENERKAALDEKMFVFEGNDRSAIQMHPNKSPELVRALKEIATHPIVRPALEKLLGPDPAFVEMVTITARYKALGQDWHEDTVDAYNQFGQTFSPTYSLFIQLQETTRAMGATHVCPGTQMCYHEDPLDYCDASEIQVTVDNPGDGIIMNSKLLHRGGNHTDPNAKERIMFTVSVAPRPNLDKHDGRIYPFGLAYFLGWDVWGHTLNDILVNGKKPWKWYKSLGLFGCRGWSLWFFELAHYSTNNIGFPFDTWLWNVMENMNIVENAEKVSFFLFKAGASMMLTLTVIQCLLSVVFFKTLPLKRQMSKWSQLIRMQILMASVVAVFVMVCYNTDFAARARNGTLHPPPNFPVAPKTDDKVYARAAARDVLIADRYHMRYQYAHHRYVDYHPGNMYMQSVVQGVGSLYEEQAAVVKSAVVSKILNLMGADGRRFLLQDRYGGFLRMDPGDSDVRDYVHRSVVKENNSLMWNLSDELDIQLGHAKYGRGAVSQNLSQDLLLSLRNGIFDSVGSGLLEADEKTKKLSSSKLMKTDLLSRPSAARTKLQ